MNSPSKYLKILTDRDFGLPVKPFNHPRIRFGARGIILNQNHEVAILNKVNKNEYKLIGGGLEDGETPEEAFKREAYEESGCEIKILKSLGEIREEKSHGNFIQDSYIFLAHATKDTGGLHLTTKEVSEGSKLLWLPLEEALEKIKNCEDKLQESDYESVYHTKFIVRRDYEILKFYQTLQ